MTGYPSSPSVHRSWGFSLRTQLDNRGWERWATLGSGAAAVGIPTLELDWMHLVTRDLTHPWTEMHGSMLESTQHRGAKKTADAGAQCCIWCLLDQSSWSITGGEQSTCRWTDEISWKHAETSCIALRCPLIILDSFYTWSLINPLGCQIGLVHLICNTTSTLFFVMLSLPVAPFDCVQAQVLIASWFRGHLTRMGGFFM